MFVSGFTQHRLHYLVISFWADIIRLQAYHNINDPDRHKYAAFIFKWVSKARPIKIADGCKYLETEKGFYFHANAHFAFLCAYSFLDCKLPNVDEYKNIIYTASYRDIHPEQWAILFHFMEKANSKTTIDESSDK